MAITDWNPEDRPREKLLNRGAATLSDAELLAIFLRTGVKGRSAVDLARDLIDEFGGLRGLLRADQKAFCEAKGLGAAKYTQLAAVMEMARRNLDETLRRGDALESPEQTAGYLAMHLREKTREVFAALFLDNRHRVIAYEELFQGTVDGAQIHAREVVKRALELNACALIVAHNHPSGISEPSLSDQTVTRRLKAALAMVEVRLLDHMVIGDGEWASMADRGML